MSPIYEKKHKTRSLRILVNYFFSFLITFIFRLQLTYSFTLISGVKRIYITYEVITSKNLVAI